MSLLSLVHVSTGALAVLLGAIALAARKGSPAHISAGRGFVATMIATSGIGAALGLMNYESLLITFHAGVLSVYLVITGWLAARDCKKAMDWRTICAALVNLGNLAALVISGTIAATTEAGRFLGYPAGDYFFLAGMAGLGALSDASLFFRRGLSAKHRIARHLWRMCFGFFIAAGSAFTGPGADAFPEAVRRSGILSLPELIIFALMLFWLARTLLPSRAHVQGRST